MTLAFACAASACNAISGIEDFSTSAVLSRPGEDDASIGSTDDATSNTDPDPSSDAEPIVDAGHVSDDASTNPEDSGSNVEDAESDAPVTPVTKRVFITNAKFVGDFGGANAGLAKADKACATAATNAQLGGTWSAWLSTNGVSAIDRITFDGPYVRLDGELVVEKKSDLASGALIHPINVTEDKSIAGKAGNDVGVWTGTNADGKGFGSNVNAHCNSWTTQLWGGVAGDFDATDVNWTNRYGSSPNFGQSADCRYSGRFYCFEQ